MSSRNSKRTLVRRSGTGAPISSSAASGGGGGSGGGSGSVITSDDLWQTMNSGRSLTQPQSSLYKRTTHLPLGDDDDDVDDDDDDSHDSDVELPRPNKKHPRSKNREHDSGRNPVDTADEKESESEEDQRTSATLKEMKKRRQDTNIGNRTTQQSRRHEEDVNRSLDYAIIEPIVALPPQSQVATPLRSKKTLERQLPQQFQQQQPQQFQQQQPQQFQQQQLQQFQQQQPQQFQQQQPQQFQQQQPQQFQQQQPQQFQQQQPHKFQQQQQLLMQPQSTHSSQTFEAVQMAGVSLPQPPQPPSQSENELLAQWLNVESIWRKTSSNRRSTGVSGLGRSLFTSHATHRSATMNLAASMNDSASQNCWAMLAYVDVEKCITRFQLTSSQQLYEMHRIVANVRRELLTLCDYAQRIGVNVNVPPKAIKDARKLLRIDEQKLRAWDEQPDQLCDSSDDEEDRQQCRKRLRQQRAEPRRSVCGAAAQTEADGGAVAQIGADGGAAAQTGTDGETPVTQIADDEVFMAEKQKVSSRTSVISSDDDNLSEQRPQNAAFDDENMLEPWGIVIPQDAELRQQGLLELVAGFDRAIFELIQCITTRGSGFNLCQDASNADAFASVNGFINQQVSDYLRERISFRFTDEKNKLHKLRGCFLVSLEQLEANAARNLKYPTLQDRSRLLPKIAAEYVLRDLFGSSDKDVPVFLSISRRQKMDHFDLLSKRKSLSAKAVPITAAESFNSGLLGLVEIAHVEYKMNKANTKGYIMLKGYVTCTISFNSTDFTDKK